MNAHKDYAGAASSAIARGVDFSKDFFAQNVGGTCAELAREYGYRKPKNANGSTGRYFFARMQRDKRKRDIARLTERNKLNPALRALRRNVTGAIERGESHAIAGCCAMGLCGPEAAERARQQSKD